MIRRIAVIAVMGLFATACTSKPKATTEATAKAEAVKTEAAKTATAATDKAATKAPEKGEMLCERAKESRSLRLEDVQPKGCKLWYSNHGSEPVAWSDVGPTHCEQVRDRIRTNLESAGFKCSATN